MDEMLRGQTNKNDTQNIKQAINITDEDISKDNLLNTSKNDNEKSEDCEEKSENNSNTNDENKTT